MLEALNFWAWVWQPMATYEQMLEESGAAF